MEWKGQREFNAVDSNGRKGMKGFENLDEVMPPLPERRRRVRRDEAVLECAQEVGALALREPRRVHYAVARSAQVRPHDDLRQILDALLELRLHVHVHVFCSVLRSYSPHNEH